MLGPVRNSTRVTSMIQSGIYRSIRLGTDNWVGRPHFGEGGVFRLTRLILPNGSGSLIAGGPSLRLTLSRTTDAHTTIANAGRTIIGCNRRCREHLWKCCLHSKTAWSALQNLSDGALRPNLGKSISQRLHARRTYACFSTLLPWN